MNINRLSLLISLAIFGSITLPAAEPTTLRVLCYNIHYGLGDDGEYNLQRLADVIKQAKPDLVALQELDVVVERSGKVHQAQRLATLTGMAVRFGPTQHFQGGLYGNAVLTRLPIDDVQIQPLPYTESTADRTTYPRAAIAVTVRVADQRRLRFISTHFQHNVPEDRVREATAINRLFGSDSIPTILAGDMNATPSSEPIRILENSWTNAIDPGASPTAPAKDPKTRIDYIFYRGDSLKLVESSVIAEPMASDHCPVLAVFRF